VKVTPVGVQAEKALDLGITLITSTSMSKLFGTRVTGSWSKSGVFIAAT
jgi:hypothetical protein